MISKTINSNYLVESNYDLTQELEDHPEQVIDWGSLSPGSKFYDINGNEYYIQEISHNAKYVKIF